MTATFQLYNMCILSVQLVMLFRRFQVCITI
jgi:hypothetical protein